jgi:hypothetical protein
VTATSGSGKVNYKVAALPDGAPNRSGTMAIAGRTVYINQVR